MPVGNALLTVTGNIMLDVNCSTNDGDFLCSDEEYLFDRTEVKTTLVIAYTFVFFSCFVGNLLVILVVILHRQLRTITNFFLANLAFADLCVGVFCVYQNLSQYLITSWIWGEFLCKMYHFVETLSYTCSVAILTVIAVERYLVIIHPIRSKQIMTLKRLKIVIATVWILSAAYSIPRLIMFGTGMDPFRISNGKPDIICVLQRTVYDTEIYDSVNFALCFLLPLTVITVLYFRIGKELWKETDTIMFIGNKKKLSSHDAMTSAHSNHPSSLRKKLKNTSICCIEGGNIKSSPGTVKVVLVKSSQNLSYAEPSPSSGMPGRDSLKSDNNDTIPHAPLTDSVIRIRRKVVRMLIAVVLSFALCNLPYHARKMWQYWNPNYDGSSEMSAILTPITFLIMYLNAGLNPILYAFHSSHFRKSMRDVLFCRVLKSRQFNRQNSSRSTFRTSLRSTLS